MSALPKPEPEPPPADPADADGWALLEALRRRLDDQASQGRRTQSQVTQLADSIAALVGEQRRRSKWLNLNSFVAYLIFTLVVGSGFYALYRSRANELLEARDTARRERDLAVRRADETSAKLTAREQADTRAWEVPELLDAGKRTEAVAKLTALGEQPLSRTERAVLAARAHETQVMEVDAALKAAAAAFKGGRHADVIAPLEAALVGEPAGARAASMHYFLGVARAKGNDLAKAVAHLQAAIADDVHEDARFQLASALDRSGQYARARVEYDQFATAHPQSYLAPFAMRRSATLARMPATQPVAPAPAMAASATAPNAARPTPPKPAAPAPVVVTPKPIAPPTAVAPKPAWKPAPKVAPAPKPAAPVDPAPDPAASSAPAEPEKVNPYSSSSSPRVGAQRVALHVEPLSTTSIERAPVKDAPKSDLDRSPRTPAPTPPVPSTPTERTPPPSPQPPIEREPAPAPRQPPRGDTTIEREQFSTTTIERAPEKDRKPTTVEPTPARDRKPPGDLDSNRAAPAPSTPLPGLPIERAPAPSPQPPVDREPPPAPRTPPRAETTPPHERF